MSMTKSEKKAWFPAKKYGWGWGFPITWQGWVVFTTYLVLLLAGGYKAQTTSTLSSPQFTLFFAGITVVLLGICWWKGEKPGWHWGNK